MSSNKSVRWVWTSENKRFGAYFPMNTRGGYNCFLKLRDGITALKNYKKSMWQHAWKVKDRLMQDIMVV